MGLNWGSLISLRLVIIFLFILFLVTFLDLIWESVSFVYAAAATVFTQFLFYNLVFPFRGHSSDFLT